MEKDVELCERIATEGEQEKEPSLVKTEKKEFKMIGLDRDDDETYSVPSF